MAFQAVIGDTISILTAVVVGVLVPGDGSAIAGSGDEQQRAVGLLGAGEGGNPATVALQESFVVHV